MGGCLPGVDVGLQGGGQVLVQVQCDCWRCLQFEGQCTALLVRESQALQCHRCGTGVPGSIWLDPHTSNRGASMVLLTIGLITKQAHREQVRREQRERPCAS